LVKRPYPLNDQSDSFEGPAGKVPLNDGAEIQHHTLVVEFCRFESLAALVLLVKGGEWVFSVLSEVRADKVRLQRERLCPEFRTGFHVTGIDVSRMQMSKTDARNFQHSRTSVF
jgi:hypothetical protein